MGEQTFRSKIIALYLPQFYETEENNQWWGKGYSDWVAVKKSKAYFSGQTQPRIPLNHNYYDLSKSETLQWQADLLINMELMAFAYTITIPMEN